MSHVLHAPTLFQGAVAAYRLTAQGSTTERAPNQAHALTAIIYSAATLEAFINEVADIASHDIAQPNLSNPPSVAMFAEALKEVERSRGSIKLKFWMTKWVFSGEPYDTGAEPYQDFSLLVDLRNELLHMDAESYAATGGVTGYRPPAVIESLRSKNILAVGGASPGWMSLLMTVAAARWACNTVTRMVHSILEVLPEDSHFRNLMTGLYGWFFQPI